MPNPGQLNFNVRCEWGLPGIRWVGSSADVVIIVDVLSFSTCVDVAVARGAKVIPYQWQDETASAYASQIGAELAGPRGQTGQFSLSPLSMRNAVAGTRIVLPSPNGSELTTESPTSGRMVLAGCFRNCQAVAAFAAAHGKAIAVIPCGERWPNGTLRPAVEDFAAAGAIIASLPGALSPEASAAIAVWNAARNDMSNFLASCVSGQELIERGFEEDIRIASEINASTTVPTLHEGAYICVGDTVTWRGVARQ
jgi:2-phosphosulfolactate phosphatase